MDSESVGHYYILDPSALVYGGIGKIKQWVDSTIQNYKKGNKTSRIIFYVPSYTLRELDFLKKVFNPLISANARESIRFIDSQISESHLDAVGHGYDHEDEFDEAYTSMSGDDSDFGTVSDDESQSDPLSNASLSGLSAGVESNVNLALNKRKVDKPRHSESEDYTDFESYNKMKQVRGEFELDKRKAVRPVCFVLESEKNVGPDWKIASGYRRSTPLLSELPKPINGYSSKGQLLNDDNRKFAVGVFGNNIPGSFNVSAKSNSGQANSGNNPSVNSVGDSEKAVVPMRLKFLIRSCIQKQYIERKSLKEGEKINWDVICEDATTSIWLRNFGLSVKTLNDVQNDFDKLSGGTDTKVLFDPDSGKLVETSFTKSNRKDTGAKSFKGQRNKGKKVKEGKEGKDTKEVKKDNKSEENEDLNKRISGKKKNWKKQQKMAKNDAISKTSSSKKHVISADTYAERGQGELWTP